MTSPKDRDAQYLAASELESRIESTASKTIEIDRIYKNESRKVFATLVRMLGDFDLAEEALQEAFSAAIEKWRRTGIPENPSAWLISAGRFKAIDSIRRKARFDKSIAALAEVIEESVEPTDPDLVDFKDDLLRLIFTCCHPALSENARLALTLREVCGMSTEEIASAFLSSPATIAQRIVRAKAKIKRAGIPYEIPDSSAISERLESVLSVIYLLFNEGYYTSRGEEALRADLSEQALRLGRVLFSMLPDSEVAGLLALMLLHESRRRTRLDENGDIVLLEDQDRAKWHKPYIDEGLQLLEAAMRSGEIGSLTVQAAISAVHATAARAEDTDWKKILYYYDLLERIEPSPIVSLNRAVAVAMQGDLESGLVLIDDLLENGILDNYQLAHAARADLLRRLNRAQEARKSYLDALALTKQEPERRFLEKRLKELSYIESKNSI